MERLDMVPRSQEEKCVLKYVIYTPDRPVRDFKFYR